MPQSAASRQLCIMFCDFADFRTLHRTLQAEVPNTIKARLRTLRTLPIATTEQYEHCQSLRQNSPNVPSLYIATHRTFSATTLVRPELPHLFQNVPPEHLSSAHHNLYTTNTLKLHFTTTEQPERLVTEQSYNLKLAVTKLRTIRFPPLAAARRTGLG